MEINTKFNVGNKVWVMSDNRPVEFRITDISIHVGKQNIPEIKYYVAGFPQATWNNRYICEGLCFATKTECVLSLMEDEI